MNALTRKLLSVPARGWQLLRLLSEAETRQRISRAAEHYGVSTLAVLLRIVKLYLAARFYPLESLANGLANPRKPFESYREYFSREELHDLQVAVNSSHAAMCRDKLLFHVYCRYHELPVPRLYGVLSRNASRTDAGHSLDQEDRMLEFIRDNLPARFIAKPRGGNKGRGIMLMGTGMEQAGGTEYGKLRNELNEVARGPEDYLLEQQLEIHPDIRRLTGTDAISTVRVITFVPFAESPQVIGAILRVIANDSITDNISDFETGGYSGNLLASPDLETGIIDWAITPCRDGVDRELIDAHPRTGEALKGFSIPLWEEVQELVTTAAGCFLPLRAIGWDVAITPTGPVLIEANELFQYSSYGKQVISIREALVSERKRLSSIAFKS